MRDDEILKLFERSETIDEIEKIPIRKTTWEILKEVDILMRKHKGWKPVDWGALRRGRWMIFTLGGMQENDKRNRVPSQPRKGHAL